jgi:hypothetical protein
LRFGHLAPDIVGAIAEGRQRRCIIVKRLLQGGPCVWAEQRNCAELFEALFLKQPELTAALLDGLMRRCCDPGKAIWLVVPRCGQPTAFKSLAHSMMAPITMISCSAPGKSA